MKEINGLTMRSLENLNDRKWFSYIKNLSEDVDFGNVELSLTVKNGQITTIKVRSEASFSVQNAKLGQ